MALSKLTNLAYPHFRASVRIKDKPLNPYSFFIALSGQTYQNYFYLRAVIQKVLYIIPLLLLLLSFQADGLCKRAVPTSPIEQAQWKLYAAETQTGQLQAKSQMKAHRSSPCIATRPQVVATRAERILEGTGKENNLHLQQIQNVHIKLSESRLANHAIRLSSLRCRAGHWVYALRKLLI